MKKIGLAIIVLLVPILPGWLYESEASHGTDYASCKNDGLYDGENNPFSQGLYEMCGDTYYHFFIEGCMSVEGNDKEECEEATDAD